MKTLAFNTGKHFRKASFILFIFTSMFASCSSDSNDIDEVYTTPKNETPSSSPVIYTSLEVEVLDLVNAYRIENNLPELKSLDIISKVAETHTNYMYEQQEASHDNFSQRSKQLTSQAKAKSVGENVAFGFRSAEGVLNGWKKSKGHKDILDTAKYTHFGISTKSDNDGRYYFTLLLIEK